MIFTCFILAEGVEMISEDKLKQAMGDSGFEPKDEFLQAVVKGTNENFDDNKMAAMFLAQLAHESGGFQFIEEQGCEDGSCAGNYGGEGGKSYHGRGFIQLSWPDNYEAAGQALGMGSELKDAPEKVAEDPELGFKVSLWFWQDRVESAEGVKDFKFGATTKAINGELECNGDNLDKSKKRFEIYEKVAEAMGIDEKASEEGCY